MASAATGGGRANKVPRTTIARDRQGDGEGAGLYPGARATQWEFLRDPAAE